MSSMDKTADQSASLDVGDVLQGRYELKGELGEGGFARVFMAFDSTIERKVAIKVLHANKMVGKGEPAKLVRSRFLREARLAAQIRHPSIIEIYDFGVLEELDQPYMIMEFLEGTDLDEEIEEKGALSPQRFLPLFIDALEALGEAHEKGVVHKDLKPANLFLTNPGTNKETLKVVDFGIAHVDHGAEERLTKTGAMTGTPHYLPPEYLEEQEVLTEMDVYQMGLILIEALTGRRVVTAETVFQAVLKHVNRDLNIPPVLLQGSLGTVIRRAIAYDPKVRYSTATEFAEALSRIDPADVVDFNAPGSVEGLEPVSLAETLKSGTLQPLSDEDGALVAEREVLAKSLVSRQRHTAGAEAKIDGTHPEFGSTETQEAAKIAGASPATDTLETEDEQAAPPSGTFGTLSTEQVEAAFGSTWPLKVLAGLGAAILVTLGAVVALMIVGNGEDEGDVAEAAVVQQETGEEAPKEEPEPEGVAQQPEETTEDGEEESPREPAEEEREESELLTVLVESTPSGATLRRMDGTEVGTTPEELELEEGQRLRLVVESTGYESQEVVVDAAELDGQPLAVELDREAAPAPTPTPTPTPVTEDPDEDEENDEDEGEDSWALPGEDDSQDDDDDGPGGFELAP